MIIRNKLYLIPALALGLTLAFNSQAMAQSSRHMGNNGGSFMQRDCLNKLNLTDAQDKQMQVLREKMWDKRSDNRNNSQGMMRNQEGFKALMDGANFDEAKAKQLLTEQKNTRSEFQLERLKFQHEMAQILTPEQRAKAATCSTERYDRKNRGGCSNSRNNYKNNRR
ncbi:periplasmic repressor CpxP [Gammaproteobacteria bacterium]|nr:periplasmic repressor CpxP [Gammaproteobacteria bacterium]